MWPHFLKGELPFWSSVLVFAPLLTEGWDRDLCPAVLQLEGQTRVENSLWGSGQSASLSDGRETCQSLVLKGKAVCCSFDKLGPALAGVAQWGWAFMYVCLAGCDCFSPHMWS